MKSIKQVLKQDRTPFIFASILMFIGLSLLLFGFLSACNGRQGTPANVQTDSAPFVNGEILAPDYAHNDSLIVINASELNRIFDGVDVSILPTTDSEINDVLHKYCRSVSKECNLRDYQIELHLDTAWLYDADRLVGRHIDTSWNHGAWIDSTMLKDNL